METQLTSEKKLTPKDICRDESLRTALYIIISVMVHQALSLQAIEGLYMVTIHVQMGLTVTQSMQANFVIHLLFAPLRMMGTLLMDRYGRRFVFCLAAALA